MSAAEPGSWGVTGGRCGAARGGAGVLSLRRRTELWRESGRGSESESDTRQLSTVA